MTLSENGGIVCRKYGCELPGDALYIDVVAHEDGCDPLAKALADLEAGVPTAEINRRIEGSR